MLLNTATGELHPLAEGVTGDDLAWANDSRSLYASSPNGDTPEIVRISLTGHRYHAVDLSVYGHLRGRVDTWFAVDPQGLILFTRVVHELELVAANYVIR
jgi:hypothetical protein